MSNKPMLIPPQIKALMMRPPPMPTPQAHPENCECSICMMRKCIEIQTGFIREQAQDLRKVRELNERIADELARLRRDQTVLAEVKRREDNLAKPPPPAAPATKPTKSHKKKKR